MIELPEEIKQEEVTATLSEEGVLDVMLPKKAPKQKQKLTVK